MSAPSTEQPVLQVRDLTVQVDSDRGPVRILDHVTFDLRAGETVSIVGESGSGKSMTLRSVLGLLPNNASISDGEIRYGDVDLAHAPEREMQRIRGGQIAMIFQDPMTALNPVMTIGDQIAESLKRHAPGQGRQERRRRIVELLDLVRIPDAARRSSQFPHEFSGGMRQRAMIAMAMANHPRVLLADEPTTALDVTVQAQILSLLAELQREMSMGLLLITHDLGVVAEVADRAAVMYAGRIIESGTVAELFEQPRHPYTRGLLDSRPTLGGAGEELFAIPGRPPSLASLPSGCAFQPRCVTSRGRDLCRTTSPVPVSIGRRTVACHFQEELGDAAEARVLTTGEGAAR